MVYKLYRLEHFFYKCKIIPFAFLIRVIIRILFSCDIPYQMIIGNGTVFPHQALGCLFHRDVIIGSNCKILHNVTIGGRSSCKSVPVVGDNVLIGTGSIILGAVKIGNNSIIGAGSVVVKDVPANAVVVGNPAKIIKLNEEDYNEK